MTSKWIRLKYLADINRDSLPETADPELEIRYIDISSVGQGRLVAEPSIMLFSEAPVRARRLVRKNDVIISTVRTYLRAVWPVHEPTDDLVVSTGFAVVSPHSIDARYLSWCLQSDIFLDELTARSVGVSYPAVDVETLGNTRILLPSIAKQRSIAERLHQQTASIDQLINAQRRRIEAIEERMQSYTYSLLEGAEQAQASYPPAAPLDEDVDTWWPHKIAWHKQTSSGTTPKSGSAEYYDKVDGVPWVTTSELRERTIDATAQRVSDAAFRDYSALKVFPEGTVLVAMYGATIGRVGTLGVPAATNQACCAIFGGETLDQRYLYWWLRANTGLLLSMALGAGQPNISQELIRSLRVLAPSVDKQRKIAQEIERTTAKVELLKQRANQLLEVLAERRRTLITSAVTGATKVTERSD